MSLLSDVVLTETAAITANIAVSLAIVALNREILSIFPFAFTLSCLHALFGVVVFFAARLAGCFSPKWFSWRDMALCGILTVGCVGFFNLTLQYCSVGFYQLAKLAVIPTVLLWETVFYGKVHTRKTILVVAVLMLGIGIATVSDVVYSSKGLVMASVAVVATAANSVRVHELSKSYAVGPNEYNFNNQLGALGFGPGLVFWMDFRREDHSVLSLSSADGSRQGLGLLVLGSCVLALAVNFLATYLIATTSPLTYQVVGHAKTCLVFTMGWVWFPGGEEAAPAQHRWHLAGIAVAVVASVLYSNIKLRGATERGDWLDRVSSARLQAWLNQEVRGEGWLVRREGSREEERDLMLPEAQTGEVASRGGGRKKVALKIRETGQLAGTPDSGGTGRTLLPL